MQCTPSTSRKIGLLGGSFNPIHQAHLRLALAAHEYLQLDQVQLLPAGQPWQKKALQVSADDRLAMLALAIEPYPQLQINPIEVERDGPTYTIETLQSLSVGPQYYWLMGSDQLNNFCTWRAWQEILNYVQLVVVQRPGHDIQVPSELQLELEQKGHKLIFMPFAEMSISSTEIRQKLQENQDVSTLVPAPVLDYIKRKGLYTTKIFN